MAYDFEDNCYDREDTYGTGCDDGSEIEEGFDESTLQDALKELITEGYDSSEICWENLRVNTFDEAGVLTYDKGLVIALPDGTEFQLTIVRSR